MILRGENFCMRWPCLGKHLILFPRMEYNKPGMLAEALHIQQPAIAKLEKRTDMYISTLRSHIEAMGGELEVIARFPDGDVRISDFSQI